MLNLRIHPLKSSRASFWFEKSLVSRLAQSVNQLPAKREAYGSNLG